jgi:hypothetical protein
VAEAVTRTGADVGARWTGDPITAPFWEAARERRLVIQRCRVCGTHQFYPRPYCLACLSDDVKWVEAAGTGTVYSMVTVRIPVIPELAPPYRLAIVELEEGPRIVTNIVGGECRIGDGVRVTWRERKDMPPVPVFEPTGGTDGSA